MTSLKYQLLVTDLDGTLLVGDDIARGVLEALNMMRRAGGYFTVATGRMFMSASRFVEAIEPNAPLILFNGALITSTDGVDKLDEHTISRSVVTRTVEFCRDHNVYLNFFTPHKVFSDEMPTTSVAEFLKKDRITVEKADLLELQKKHEAVKLQVTGKPADLDLVVSMLKEELHGEAAVARSEPHYFEIGPKGIHKGTAVKWIAQFLQIPMNDVVVVGDSLNDLPMLEDAAAAGGLAVCVSNANERLKSLPGVRIATSNAEGGVGYAITNYVFDESEIRYRTV